MNQLTNYLYANPSFIEGSARLLDLGSTMEEYNGSLSADQADTIALVTDWLSVGSDIQNAMNHRADVQAKITDELLAKACEALEGAGELIQG
jgi:hypothetical protein